MDDETLRDMAKKIAAKAKLFYRPGDCCPMCGYDAYWGCDSLEESENQVYEVLKAALS
jgi:hypothetical protein